MTQGPHLESREWPATRAGRRPVLLLHEGLGCVAMWRSFPERLAARSGARVLAWSRAGYGASDPHPTARTVRYLHVEAEAALPVFRSAMGVDRPVLVGHSDGATIALIHAALFPDAVAGVVAMSPHEFVEEATLRGLEAARVAWETTSWRERLGRYHRDVDRVFHEWNDTWLSPAFRDWNIEDLLPAIRCPVLAIQGEDDEYATMRQVDVIAERVPGGRVLKLPDCGHSPHLDQPDRVLEAVVTFIDGLGAPETGA